MKEYKGYCFKKGFLWIAWIVSICEDETKYYYDNSQTEEYHGIVKVKRLFFSLTQKRALKKIARAIKKKTARLKINKRRIKEDD